MEQTQKIILLTVSGVLIVAVVLLFTLGGKTNTASGSGLQESNQPWQPEYAHLSERIQHLGIPQPGQEKYHVHVQLEVYVDGQKSTVPTNIGLNQSERVLSALHTHDTGGIIHIESDAPFEVTVGTIFQVWGVKLTSSQLGAYRNEGDKTVQVYVNGQKTDQSVDYVVKPHDKIVVGYGATNSFPTTITSELPAGL